MAFLAAVCARVARLGAQWMAAGFVHGVLNTDNINITGESFDYGPWRWLPTYDPAFTAAYFDETGLYAYGRQPETLLWNLTRLAECLLPLADKDALVAALQGFAPAFRAALRRRHVAPAGRAGRGRRPMRRWPRPGGRRWPTARCRSSRRSSTRSAACWARRSATRSTRCARRSLAGRCPAPPGPPVFPPAAPCTMLIDEVEAIWAPIAAPTTGPLFHAKIAAVREMGEALGLGMRPTDPPAR